MLGPPGGLDGDSSGVDRGDARAQSRPHAEGDELPLGFVREVRREGRQHTVLALDQQDAGFGRVDVAEIVPQRVVGDFAERPGELDAGWAAADDHEGKPGVAARGVRLALGLFISQQDAAANFGGVLDGLEARRQRLPFVVAEIEMGGAGRNHQVVVGPLAVGKDHATVGDIEIHHLGK